MNEPMPAGSLDGLALSLRHHAIVSSRADVATALEGNDPLLALDLIDRDITCLCAARALVTEALDGTCSMPAESPQDLRELATVTISVAPPAQAFDGQGRLHSVVSVIANVYKPGTKR